MIIPPERLPEETLTAVIESYVLREGTDYGEHERSLADKVAQVRCQLASGDVLLTYDLETETCQLLTGQPAHR
ncbi:MAG TPA: hypothetical protein DCZ13_13515, partial [Porticoccaceae bacterium]|nr:hypothetical protein [Porticoccaceae bacterium]